MNTKRKSRTKKTLRIFFVIFCAVVAWSLLLWIYPPNEIVEYIGIGNGYLLMFIIALFGGASAITAGSYFGTLITLALGGLDPVILGVVSGLGASVGDTIFFYLGLHGRDIFQEGWLKTQIHKVSSWLDDRPRWVIMLVVYLLSGFTPMPNDITASVMGLAKRSYFGTIGPLVLGNITFTILIASFIAR